MLEYARSDTHFLLFIYDNLRNALLDRAQSRAQSPVSGEPPANAAHVLINEVLSRSEGTALRTYEKEVYDTENGSGSNGWDILAKKWNKGAFLVPGPQRSVFCAAHSWRDAVARELDESPRYVLPNHYLIRLAEFIPENMAALLSVFQPVPPIIRRKAKELFDVIRNAAETSRVGTEPAAPIEIEPEPVDAVAHSKEALQNAEPRLWSNTSLVCGITTSKSSLFGSTLAYDEVTKPPTTPYTASTSSLFGAVSASPVRLFSLFA
jgi:exosome complex exonuclease RRP6